MAKLPKSPKAAKNRAKQLRKSADSMEKRALLLEKRKAESVKKAGCRVVTICTRKKKSKKATPSAG